MKIAIYHNLPSGGAKRALFEWSSRLSQRHELSVYSLSTADHNFCDIKPFTQNHRVMDFSPRKLLRFPAGRFNQFQRWKDLKDLERLHIQIAKEMNTGEYDLLFAHADMFTLIPSILSHIEIPSIYYLHEPFGASLVAPVRTDSSFPAKIRGYMNRMDPLISLYWRQLEMVRSRALLNTDLLMSNSKFTSEHIERSYGVSSVLCQYGVNLEGFRPIPDTVRSNFVVSVGELSVRKGFDFVIESLGQIPSVDRPLLKIACNSIVPSEKAYIEKLAADYCVRLEILFGLNTDELRLLYNAARFCVYAPILEPFGLVPLEAMACGRAVVGVKEAGVKESVLHEVTGLLTSRDSKEFGAAILRLLKDPFLADTYGQNGRNYVLENWSWEKSVDQLEKHMQQVVL